MTLNQQWILNITASWHLTITWGRSKRDSKNGRYVTVDSAWNDIWQLEFWTFFITHLSNFHLWWDGKNYNSTTRIKDTRVKPVKTCPDHILPIYTYIHTYILGTLRFFAGDYFDKNFANFSISPFAKISLP